MTPRTTRRRFVAGAGALTSLPMLFAACGSDDDSGSGDGKQRSFRFKDDAGNTITLDRLPERIVSHEYAAVALWDYGVRPVGIYASQALDEQPLLDDYDLSGIESLGELWGEVNLEALAAARPDVILSTWWPTDKMYGGIKDDKMAAKMEAIAPLLGIDAQVPATQTVRRFEQLAGALGQDTDSQKIVAARKRYEDAVERFRTVADEKPDLRLMPVYADPQLLYVGKWRTYSDLREYESWGATFVPAAGGENPYWEELSWENADKYEADIIMLDARASSPRPPELDELAGWLRLPAVEADQVTPWRMEEGVSWDLWAAHVDELAGAMETAERLT